MADTDLAQAPTGSAFNYNSIVKQAAGQLDDDKKLETQVSTRNKKIEEDLGKLPDFSKREPPKAPEISEPPKPQQTDPFQAFGSAASAFGILASLMTRHPLTSALNASSAAMKAIHENDVETYKQQYEAWKTHTDYAFKRAQFENDRYNMLINNDKLTVDEIMSKASVEASLNNDPIKLSAIRSGHIDTLVNIVTAEKNSLEKAKEHRDTMDVEWARVWAQQAEKGQNLGTTAGLIGFTEKLRGIREKDPALADAIEKNFQTMHPGLTIAGMKAAEDPKKAAFAAFIAETVEKTGKPPTAQQQADWNKANSNTRQRSAASMAAQSFIDKYRKEHGEDPDPMDIAGFAADFTALNAAVKDFSGAGKGAITIQSFNTVTQHLDTLEQLSMALKNNDVQAFNRLGNRWASETGKAAPTNFEAAKDIIGGEIVKSIIGQAGTGGDRDKAQSAFDAANSPAQLLGALNTVRSLVHGQLDGLEKRYVDSVAVPRGQTEEQGQQAFRNRLTPAARKMLGAEASGETLPKDTGKKWAHSAGNGKAVSDDGIHWFNPDGTPYVSVKQ
jgi:hypothetical protein